VSAEAIDMSTRSIRSCVTVIPITSFSQLVDVVEVRVVGLVLCLFGLFVSEVGPSRLKKSLSSPPHSKIP